MVGEESFSNCIISFTCFIQDSIVAPVTSDNSISALVAPLWKEGRERTRFGSRTWSVDTILLIYPKFSFLSLAWEDGER